MLLSCLAPRRNATAFILINKATPPTKIISSRENAKQQVEIVSDLEETMLSNTLVFQSVFFSSVLYLCWAREFCMPSRRSRET